MSTGTLLDVEETLLFSASFSRCGQGGSYIIRTIYTWFRLVKSNTLSDTEYSEFTKNYFEECPLDNTLLYLRLYARPNNVLIYKLET